MQQRLEWLWVIVRPADLLLLLCKSLFVHRVEGVRGSFGINILKHWWVDLIDFSRGRCRAGSGLLAYQLDFFIVY